MSLVRTFRILLPQYSTRGKLQIDVEIPIVIFSFSNTCVGDGGGAEWGGGVNSPGNILG